jgi:hypothetical protein
VKRGNASEQSGAFLLVSGIGYVDDALEELGDFHQGDSPLRPTEVLDPLAADDELLIQVLACGLD